jgi:hypothetical protein
MPCQRCQSERILSVGGKVADLGSFSIGEREMEGYVPYNLGIGGGDYIDFEVCLECGQQQGTWPLPKETEEKETSDWDQPLDDIPDDGDDPE